VAGKIYSAIRVFARLFLLLGGLAIAGAVTIGTYILVSNPHGAWNWLNTELTTATSSTKDFGGGFLMAVALLWFFSAVVMVLAYGRRVYLRFGDLDD
jgi:hypothetical protein